MDEFEEQFTAVFGTASLKGSRVTLVGLREFSDPKAQALFRKIEQCRPFLEEHLSWVAKTSPADLKKRSRSWVLAEQLCQGGCWQIHAGDVNDGHELDNLAGFVMIEANLQNHSAAVSYWLLQEYTGIGLMTESVNLVSRFCFEVLKLNRLELFASSVNKKSQNVAVRCGFLQEGICRDFELKNGIFVDHVRFSRLSRDS